MKVYLNITFNTDGDFRFDNFQNIIDTGSPLYNDADIDYRWIHHPDDYSYTVILKAKGGHGAILAARDILEGLICNMRTSRYYIVKDVYEMLSKPLDSLFNSSSDIDINIDTSMSGNYDGSECHFTVEYTSNEGRTRGEIEKEYEELVKDTRMVEVRPNVHEYVNQQRRTELLKEYRATLPEAMKLAIFLHDHACHQNHTDGCSWSYEINGVHEDWLGNAHKKYLEMAKAMLEDCQDIELIKHFILITNGYKPMAKGE